MISFNYETDFELDNEEQYEDWISRIIESEGFDEGEINYQHIFDKLDEIGYDGWVGCEYNPRGKTTEGLAWFEKYK